MPIPGGTRLGPYEILAPLGAGGMGEVYRARDPRLGREIAIKVLPAERLADETRRRRFVREARAASQLNHPNIVTIHEIERDGEHDFIVMELVEGRSLDKLIPRGGMAVKDALRLAIPIADAVARAHAAGIVHRDLKPTNVMVTAAGVPKVLDFGLAKLLAPEDLAEQATAAEETAASSLSHTGLVAGTPAYMSPEQAEGKSVDTRSDVFSFGSLLYEMAAGRRPFAGASRQDLLRSVISDAPRPPSALAPGVPTTLDKLILRCLRKEPERRFQHMDDVKLELLEVAEALASSTSTSAQVSTVPSPSGRRWLMAGSAGLVVLAVAAALWHSRLAKPPTPSAVQLSTERWAGAGSFSPDGAQVVYASAGDDGVNWDIWLKMIGDPQGRRLTSDPAPDSSPAWSPDGTQIAFVRLRPGSPRGIISSRVADGAVYVVSPLGGPSRRLSDLPVHGQPSWSPDGRWLVVAKARAGAEPPGGILLVSVASGESRPLTTPGAGAFHLSPAFAPDGRAIAYAACEGLELSPSCNVEVLTLDARLMPEGTARTLTREGLSNHGLVWTRDGEAIVYSAGVRLWRVRADGKGVPERMELAGFATAPAAAAGRDRLAFVRMTGDVDVYEVEPRVAPRPLAQSTLLERNPSYSSDGRRIAFQAQEGTSRSDIWLADSDGSNPVRLTRGPELSAGSPSWSPNGSWIAFDLRSADGQRDIWMVRVDGSGLSRVVQSAADDITPSWSRDGRFIYFASDRTGRMEVFRVPAGGGPEEQLTRAGGMYAAEGLDGRELYYQRTVNGALLVRASESGDERQVLPCVRSGSWAATPHGVAYQDCEATSEAGQRVRSWDSRTGVDRLWVTLDADAIQGLSVSPDGRRIIYGRTQEFSRLMMIENFR